MKTGSGAIRESASVLAEADVDVDVDVVGDGDGDGTDDVRVDALVRTCARRLVDDGLQCGDCCLVVKMLMMMVLLLLLLVLVMSAGPCVDVHVYLHFRVRVNRDENVWTEMR